MSKLSAYATAGFIGYTALVDIGSAFMVHAVGGQEMVERYKNFVKSGYPGSGAALERGLGTVAIGAGLTKLIFDKKDLGHDLK